MLVKSLITRKEKQKFYNLLEREDFCFVKNNNLDINTKFKAFIKTLTENYEASFPEKRYRTQYGHSLKPFWSILELNVCGKT